jgi:hypothetical protein
MVSWVLYSIYFRLSKNKGTNMPTQLEKQERSIAVSARVDLVTLAEITKYWISEGYHIRSVSQIVGWSIDLLKEIMIQNKAISPQFEFVSARNFMIERGLTQQSNDKRGYKKMAAATRFEMLRKDGYDPRQVDPLAYSILHNPHSIIPSPDSDMEAYNRARLEKQAEMHEQYKRERDSKISSYKDNGVTVVKDSKRDYVPNSSSFEEIQQRDAQQDSELDELINQRKGE